MAINKIGIMRSMKRAIFFLVVLVCILIFYSVRWLPSKPHTEVFSKLVTIKPKRTVTTQPSTETDIRCYSSEEKSALLDINDDIIIPNENMFFLETSCRSYLRGKYVLNGKQACSVESAARMNPNKSIYVLFTSPCNTEVKETDEYFKSLLNYNNIYLRYVNVKKFVYGSPVENVFKLNLEESRVPIIHASDILRMLILWKYGGTFLDLDMIVIKNWDNLTTNFVSILDRNCLANGVMNFRSDGIGHKVADSIVKMMGITFNPKLWGAFGLAPLTKALMELCNVSNISDMTSKKCRGFTVYDTKIFYPIAYWHLYKYFEEDKLEEVRRACNDSYSLHTWNRMSQTWGLSVGPKSPYAIYAREFCPKVYSEWSTYF